MLDRFLVPMSEWLVMYFLISAELWSSSSCSSQDLLLSVSVIVIQLFLWLCASFALFGFHLLVADWQAVLGISRCTDRSAWLRTKAFWPVAAAPRSLKLAV